MDNEDIDTLVFCSFRYALGRKTYIVNDVVDLIIKYKDQLSLNTIELIILETFEAIQEGEGSAGMQMDVNEWEKVLKCFEGDN